MKNIITAIVAVSVVGGGWVAMEYSSAQGPHGGQQNAQNSGNYKNEVRIEERDGFRYITSNGIPDHQPGQFPNRGNPNTIAPQQYNLRMSLTPQVVENYTPANRYLFAIALNGVPFDPGTGETWNNDRRWRYEALSGKIDLGIDGSNAHVQPSGAYHYHGLPNGLIQRLCEGKENNMVLVGYAGDGYPVYAIHGHAKADDAKSDLKKLRASYRLKEGTRPGGQDGPGGAYDGTFVQDWEYVEGTGDLDQANGRFGVTPEYPKGTYYYTLTDEYPFVPRYFRGKPDGSFAASRPAPRQGGPGGRGRSQGPPTGGNPPPR